VRPKESISDSEKFPITIKKQQQQQQQQTNKQPDNQTKKKNLKRPKNVRNFPSEQICKGSGLNSLGIAFQ